MLVDANLLIYSVHLGSPQQPAASAWLRSVLSGSARVGIPWLSIGAFLRISTNPRAFERPLSPSTAWNVVESWLATEVVWIPGPTSRHAAVVGRLVGAHDVRGDDVTDALLVAIAIEHGLIIQSADRGFAKFDEVRSVNPIA